MGVSVVTYGGRTLVDMTDATATEADILAGQTAYDKRGSKIVGSLVQITNEKKSITLSASGWSNNQQTVTVSGITASNTVIVKADSASEEEYISCGVRPISQAENELVFECEYVPQTALAVNLDIFT